MIQLAILIATILLIVIVFIIDKKRIIQRKKEINNFTRRGTLFPRPQSLDSSVSSNNSSFLRKQLLDGQSSYDETFRLVESKLKWFGT